MMPSCRTFMVLVKSLKTMAPEGMAIDSGAVAVVLPEPSSGG